MANYFPAEWAPYQANEINAEFNAPASLALSIGDLLYWDSSVNQVKPFSQLADLGSAAQTQASVARLFVGVSNTQRLATDTAAGIVKLKPDRIYEFACDSATFTIGDYVGASYNASILRDQQVAKVSYPHLAIGRVVKRYSAATTKVKVRLLSRYLGLANNDIFHGLQDGVLLAAADADTTMTIDSAKIVTMTPTANPRKLILPPETLSKNLTFHIFNLAAATNGIQVRNSADSATIITIPAAKAGYVICDGTTWRGLVGA